jgi:pSer/pThr/pTyr-binding forkhead associated (FHA) protein
MNSAMLYQIGEDGSPAQHWALEQGAVVVGRGGQAQVSLKDEGLSRRHFIIMHEGEDYVIKDLNSRNGTWVGGQRVLSEKLHHNDLILAGHTRFRFAAPRRMPSVLDRELTGPHGTVVLPAIRMPQRNLPEPALMAED